MENLNTRNFEGSDTVTVTTEGRTIVDPQKLLKKQHVKDLIARISQKSHPGGAWVPGETFRKPSGK